MRNPASEKLESIRLVEESHLSARQALAGLGIPRPTFDRKLRCGEAGLQDQSPKPKQVSYRIPTKAKQKVGKLALKETELPPREPSVKVSTKKRSKRGAYITDNAPHTHTNEMNHPLLWLGRPLVSESRPTNSRKLLKPK